MSRKTTLSIFAILLCGTASVLATDRYYPDIKGQSPNGRYVAEAKSPDNQQEVYMAFQRNFTVTFTDTQNNKTLWLWKQGEDNYRSPKELIPTDNGQLILNADGEYRLFDTQGVERSVFKIWDLVPKEEWAKFTSKTTAGTKWRQYSQQDFLTLDGTAYFYFRLYWGRIFAVNMDQMKLETEPKIMEQVEDHIVEKTKKLITEFDGEYYEKCASCDGDHLRADLSSAVFVIKKHNILEGMKLLDEVVEKHWRSAGEYSFELKKFVEVERGSNDLKRYLDLL